MGKKRDSTGLWKNEKDSSPDTIQAMGSFSHIEVEMFTEGLSATMILNWHKIRYGEPGAGMLKAAKKSWVQWPEEERHTNDEQSR